MTIKNMAIARAIQFLRAGGADYFIYKDGEIVADTFPKRTDPTLPPRRLREAPVAAPVTLRRRRSAKNDFITLTGYTETLATLQPGQEARWERANYPAFKNMDTWHSFTATVSSMMRRYFGEDNIVIDRERAKSISVMRIDPKAEERKPERKPVKRAPQPVQVEVKVEGVDIDKAHKAIIKAAEVTDPKKAHRKRGKRSFAVTKYGEKIRAMQPGETLEWKRSDYDILQSKAAWLSFATSAMGYARRIYPDQTVSEMKSAGGTLRILRVK